jgi:hypothetical protein
MITSFGKKRLESSEMHAQGIPPHLLYIEKIMSLEEKLDTMTERLASIEEQLVALDATVTQLATEGVSQVGEQRFQTWIKESITTVLGVMYNWPTTATATQPMPSPVFQILQLVLLLRQQ